MRSRSWISLILVLLLAMATTVLLPIRAQAATTFINCTPNVQYPHRSTHEDGRVNVVATVYCDGGVSTISISVNLYRDGVLVNSTSTHADGPGLVSWQNQADEPCWSGHTYTADAGVTIWFPPYYQGGKLVTEPTLTKVLDLTPQLVINCSTMLAGTDLDPGTRLVSRSGAYSTIMQTDGNLVTYGPGGATWSTCTNGRGPSILSFQTDGNAVIYSASHIARWAAGSYVPGSVLTLQDDGNLVVYAPGHIAVWASNQHRC